MVVMPMKDRLQYYFDSPRGAKLAQLVTERLQAKRHELGKGDAIEVVPFEDLVYAVNTRHLDPKDIQPQDLGRMVKADLVLMGDLTQFETKIPGDVGLARGRAAVDLRVIEVAKPDRAFLKRTVKVAYPPEGHVSTGVLAPSEGGEEEIELGLVALLVDRIAQLFHVHEAEKD